ncbi:hypothetical protein Tco_1543734, partial [Tanacetum coccineum]
QNHEHERLQKSGTILDNSKNTRHEIMEEASLITTTLIRKKKEDRMDMHGLPPTKRLFKEKAGKLSSPDMMNKEEISPYKKEHHD